MLIIVNFVFMMHFEDVFYTFIVFLKILIQIFLRVFSYVDFRRFGLITQSRCPHSSFAPQPNRLEIAIAANTRLI